MDDVVYFGVWINERELQNILKLHRCPSDLQDKVEDFVTDYWDFYGFLRYIRVFLFQIDTGNHPPIFYKPPRYIIHQYEFMRKLL